MTLIIFSNLLPVFGIFVFHWGFIRLLGIYFLESVVSEFFFLMKVLIVRRLMRGMRGTSEAQSFSGRHIKAYLRSVFDLSLIYILLLLFLFAFERDQLSIRQMFLEILQGVSDPSVWVVMAGFFLNYGMDFVMYFANREYQKTSLQDSARQSVIIFPILWGMLAVYTVLIHFSSLVFEERVRELLPYSVLILFTVKTAVEIRIKTSVNAWSKASDPFAPKKSKKTLDQFYQSTLGKAIYLILALGIVIFPFLAFLFEWFEQRWYIWVALGLLMLGYVFLPLIVRAIDRVFDFSEKGETH